MHKDIVKVEVYYYSTFKKKHSLPKYLLKSYDDVSVNQRVMNYVLILLKVYIKVIETFPCSLKC